MDDVIEVEDVVVLRETDAAILIEAADEGIERWVPKSVIHDDSEVWKAGTEGKLVLARWFCEKNGLFGVRPE